MELETEKNFVGMENCFICGEIKSLLLDRRLKKSLPKSAVYNKEPCEKCLKIMEHGVFFIGVKNGENGENPYRTGQIIGIKEEKIKDLITNKILLNDILKKRIC